jgi:iron complex outermembrane receptor protein
MRHLYSLSYKFFLLSFFFLFLPGTIIAENAPPTAELLEMSLEDLMNIPVTSTSLTPVESNRFNPSTATVITRQDIQNSGARDLFELLEVYVPNFQWVFHGCKPRHFAIRGMISGRDDKNLLLVNGHQMNERTDLGAFTERDLPLLRDIQKIEVIRGPGSALYGPGALSMVINIITDTPKTFQGSEVTLRTGFIEEHYTSEFKWGKMFNEEEGLLLYGGASIYPGADQSDSPWRFGGTPLKENGRFYGNYYTGDRMEQYNAAYDDDPRMKFHAHYIKGNWSVWMRYTQGGEYVSQTEWGALENGRRQRELKYGVGYRQFTLASDYKQEITDDFVLNYHAGYDRTNIETVPYRVSRELLYREDKYTGRVLANWTINDKHQAAFGAEVRHDEYGLDPDGWDETLNYVMSGGTGSTPREMPRWGTNMFSLLGEYQWTILDNLKFFFGIRQDDHNFSEQMVSPRASLIYAMDEKNTFKIMLTKSSRTNVAEEMKRDDLRGNSNSDFETLKAREFRWEHRHSNRLWLATSFFKHDHDLVSWSYTSNGNAPVANLKSYGVEFEAKYKQQDNLEIIFSHAYTKLNHARLAPGVTYIQETSAPIGYGYDFANWSNHQSKMHVNCKLDEKWLLTNSVVVNWGYPGGEDYAKWRRGSATNFNTYNPNADEVFGTDIFWNIGLQFEYSKNLAIRADAYNILGWFDRDLAQRRFGFSDDIPGAARIQPVAFGLKMIYKF